MIAMVGLGRVGLEGGVALRAGSSRVHETGDREVDQTQLISTPDGRTLAVCQWGPSDGSPLFFLHGTLGGRLLRHVQGEYERNRLRVVTYDRPGFGGSTRRPGRRVAEGAEDLLTIADQLALDTFAVAGVSGGGPYALAVAATSPDRVTRCATIVSGPPLVVALGEDLVGDLAPEVRDELQAMLAGGEPYLLSDYGKALAWLQEFAAEPVTEAAAVEKQMVVHAFRDALSGGPFGYVDDCLAELKPHGFILTDVAAPTVIMLARDDEGVPATHGDWLMRQLPNAELRWVDGGHFGPRQEAEEQLLRWLGGR
jgi:pimeloyl-ACP methyl ester carboxylesterase